MVIVGIQMRYLLVLLAGWSATVATAETFYICAALNPNNLQEEYQDHAYQLAFVELTLGVIERESPEEVASKFETVLIQSDSVSTIMSAPIGSDMLEMRIYYGDTSVSTFVSTTFDNCLGEQGGNTSKVFFLGGYGSSGEIFKAEWANTTEAVLVTGGGAASEIFNDRPTVFGLLSSIFELASFTLDFLKNQTDSGLLKPKPGKSKIGVAVLYEDAAHGVEYLAGVQNFVASNPLFEIVYIDIFPLYSTSFGENYGYENFTELVTNLGIKAGFGEGSADVLLVDAHSKDYVFIQTALSFLAPKLNYQAISYGARGTDDSDISGILQETRKITIENIPNSEKNLFGQSMNGLFAVQWWTPGLKSKSNREFVTSWRKAEVHRWIDSLNQLPLGSDLYSFAQPSDQLPATWFSAVAYEAFRVLYRAIQCNIAKTYPTPIQCLEKTMITGSLLPGSKLVFGSNGQVESLFAIEQNDDVPNPELALQTLPSFYPRVVIPADQPYLAYPEFTSPRPSCTSDWVTVSISACANGNIRVVSHGWQYQDSQPCPGDATVSCYCDASGSYSLPSSYDIECEYIVNDSGVGKLIQGLAYSGLTTCLALGIVLAFSWNHAILQGCKRPYLLSFILAGTCCALSLLTLLGENTDSTCKSRVALIGLSYSLLMSTLFGKVVYWYKVWDTPTTEAYRSSPKAMSLPAVASFALYTIIVLLWTFVGGSMLTSKLQAGGQGQAFDCSYNGGPRSGFLYTYMSAFMIQLFVVLFLSSQASSVDGKYFESWYLNLASWNTLFLAILFFILDFLISLPNSAQISVFAVSVLWSSLFVVLAGVLPRIFPLYGILRFSSKKNDPSGTGDITESNSDTRDNVTAEVMVRKYLHGRKVAQLTKSGYSGMTRTVST